MMMELQQHTSNNKTTKLVKMRPCDLKPVVGPPSNVPDNNCCDNGNWPALNRFYNHKHNHNNNNNYYYYYYCYYHYYYSNQDRKSHQHHKNCHYFDHRKEHNSFNYNNNRHNNSNILQLITHKLTCCLTLIILILKLSTCGIATLNSAPTTNISGAPSATLGNKIASVSLLLNSLDTNSDVQAMNDISSNSVLSNQYAINSDSSGSNSLDSLDSSGEVELVSAEHNGDLIDDDLQAVESAQLKSNQSRLLTAPYSTVIGLLPPLISYSNVSSTNKRNATLSFAIPTHNTTTAVVVAPHFHRYHQRPHSAPIPILLTYHNRSAIVSATQQHHQIAPTEAQANLHNDSSNYNYNDLKFKPIATTISQNNSVTSTEQSTLYDGFEEAPITRNNNEGQAKQTKSLLHHHKQYHLPSGRQQQNPSSIGDENRYNSASKSIESTETSWRQQQLATDQRLRQQQQLQFQEELRDKQRTLDIVRHAQENLLESVMTTNKTRAFLSCETGDMLIKLNFTEPFKGIVYANHDRTTPCKFFGDNQRYYEFRVPLNGCGTKQEAPRLFLNNIIIRFHRSLELEEDEAKTIVCRYPPPLAPRPPPINNQVLPERIREGPPEPAKLINFDPLLILSGLLVLTLMLLGLSFGAVAAKRQATRNFTRNDPTLTEPKYPVPPSVKAQTVYDSFVDTKSIVGTTNNLSSSLDNSQRNKARQQQLQLTKPPRHSISPVISGAVNYSNIFSGQPPVITDETIIINKDDTTNVHILHHRHHLTRPIVVEPNQDLNDNIGPKYTIKDIEDTYTTRIEEIDEKVLYTSTKRPQLAAKLDHRLNEGHYQHHYPSEERPNALDQAEVSSLDEQQTIGTKSDATTGDQYKAGTFTRVKGRRHRLNSDDDFHHMNFQNNQQISNNNNSSNLHKLKQFDHQHPLSIELTNGSVDSITGSEYDFRTPHESVALNGELLLSSSPSSIVVADGDNGEAQQLSVAFVSMRPTLTSPEQFKRLQTIVDIFDETIVEHHHLLDNSSNSGLSSNNISLLDGDSQQLHHHYQQQHQQVASGHQQQQQQQKREIVYESRPRLSKYRSAIGELEVGQRAALHKLLTSDENFRSFIVECTTLGRINRKLRNNPVYCDKINEKTWSLLSRVLVDTATDQHQKQHLSNDVIANGVVGDVITNTNTLSKRNITNNDGGSGGGSGIGRSTSKQTQLLDRNSHHCVIISDDESAMSVGTIIRASHTSGSSNNNNNSNNSYNNSNNSYNNNNNNNNDIAKGVITDTGNFGPLANYSSDNDSLTRGFQASQTMDSANIYSATTVAGADLVPLPPSGDPSIEQTRATIGGRTSRQVTTNQRQAKTTKSTSRHQQYDRSGTNRTRHR